MDFFLFSSFSLFLHTFRELYIQIEWKSISGLESCMDYFLLPGHIAEENLTTSLDILG